MVELLVVRKERKKADYMVVSMAEHLVEKMVERLGHQLVE